MSALGAASVCLVLIASRWLTAADASGTQRLKREDDWVRREVREALAARGVGRMRVIPVLLQDSRVPREDELPHDIKGLATLNGFVLGSVALDSPKLADIIERRYSVLEPAIVMALAAGIGLAIRSGHRWIARAPNMKGLDGVGVSAWFLEMAGTALNYGMLVLGVLLAVRSRTGWRMPEMAKVVACAVLGLVSTHTLLTPVFPAENPWAAPVRLAVWFAGAASGAAFAIHRYAPTLRVSPSQWVRLGAVVITMAALGGMLQGLVAEAAGWIRNPRTLFWGPVLLGFAAVWQAGSRKVPQTAPRKVPWGVVIPVVLAMLAADALAVLTSPIYVGMSSDSARRLIDAKDAYNSAVFFGVAAAVIAWRLNVAMREDEARESRLDLA